MSEPKSDALPLGDAPKKLFLPPWYACVTWPTTRYRGRTNSCKAIIALILTQVCTLTCEAIKGRVANKFKYPCLNLLIVSQACAEQVAEHLLRLLLCTCSAYCFALATHKLSRALFARATGNSFLATPVFL